MVSSQLDYLQRSLTSTAALFANAPQMASELAEPAPTEPMLPQVPVTF